MYDNSKIISFAMNLGDGFEKAYRYSYFCKFTKSIRHSFKNIWSDSVFGQMMSGIFNIETQRNSLSYKLFTQSFLAVTDFFNSKFSLEQGIAESKYINLIKRMKPSGARAQAKESIAGIVSGSIFMRCLYEFWEGMD